MCHTNEVTELFIFIQNKPMHKIPTTVLLLTLLFALAGCHKSPAPSTSFVALKYLGIDHLYTCKGLEQEDTMYIIHADESGSANKLKMSLAGVKKGNYALGLSANNEVTFWVDHDTYTSRSSRATGTISINRIDSTIYNIHATVTGHLINASDSNDYLDIGGEFNIKYKY